jgi:hypothetical protein
VEHTMPAAGYEDEGGDATPGRGAQGQGGAPRAADGAASAQAEGRAALADSCACEQQEPEETPAWQHCNTAGNPGDECQLAAQQAAYAQLHCAMDVDDQQFVIGGQVCSAALCDSLTPSLLPVAQSARSCSDAVFVFACMCQPHTTTHHDAPRTELQATRRVALQANLWTEFISDEITAEYMLLPRLCALAECVWTPPATRNWRWFLERTNALLGKLSLAGYNFRPLVFSSDAPSQPDG